MELNIVLKIKDDSSRDEQFIALMEAGRLAGFSCTNEGTPEIDENRTLRRDSIEIVFYRSK